MTGYSLLFFHLCALAGIEPWLFTALITLPEAAEKLDPKSLEAAVAFSQTLTQWAFLIMGGSVVILVGTSYYRPIGSFFRWAYLLFIPGWFCLAGSLYGGTMVQRANLGYFLIPNTVAAETRKAIIEDAYSQMRYMEYGLAFFGLWLLIYLYWWIFNASAQVTLTRQTP